MDNAESGLRRLEPKTGWTHPRPPRLSCAPQGERAAPIDLVRQARAAREALSGPRPLTETVGTGLRRLYADVLALPLPAELSRLVETLCGRAKPAPERPPREPAG